MRLTTRSIVSALCLACVYGVDAAHAQSPAAAKATQRRLADLTIEELMNERVTSVSKKETEWNHSPAAITIITQDDIRRMGITSIPEALRLAPGMEVSRIDGHTWAISARGFNNQYANKLLVLVDGRTVYEASFSGVYWDALDLAIADLDRIEVIRGPGATLWGANAVNGVINIITKPSHETQGVLLSTSIGDEDQPATTVRYGGTAGTNLSYRVWAKYFDRDPEIDLGGRIAHGDWRAGRGGFRLDWRATPADDVLLRADVYGGHASHVEDLPVSSDPSALVRGPQRGVSVMSQWRRRFSPASDLSVQGFYAGSSYNSVSGTYEDDRSDVELQYRFALASRHDIVSGVEYRHTVSALSSTPNIVWSRPRDTSNLFTAFVQDQIAIVPERLHVILGTKYEHHTLDAGWLPSARVLWTTSRHTVWAAASRALRTPSLSERFVTVTGPFIDTPDSPLPIRYEFAGQPALVAEKMNAYEIGYRVEPSPRLWFDLAAFHNDYSDVVEAPTGAPMFVPLPQPHLLVPFVVTNVSSGRSRGVEIAVQYQAADWWRLSSSYTHLHAPLLRDIAGLDAAPHRASVRSYVTLPHDVELNAALYYTSRLQTSRLPSFTRADVGVTVKLGQTLRLGVWGQNLLEAEHIELAADTFFTRPTPVRRGVVAQITWEPGR